MYSDILCLREAYIWMKHDRKHDFVGAYCTSTSVNWALEAAKSAH